jgi:hypothetical protein
MALKILASERAARPLDARDETLVVQLPAQNWTCESMVLLFDSRGWAGPVWRLVAVFRKKNPPKNRPNSRRIKNFWPIFQFSDFSAAFQWLITAEGAKLEAQELGPESLVKYRLVSPRPDPKAASP